MVKYLLSNENFLLQTSPTSWPRPCFICWVEPIMHNTQRTSHSGLGIVAMEKLNQSLASAGCGNVTHITLEVRSICKKNISSKYSIIFFTTSRLFSKWDIVHFQNHNRNNKYKLCFYNVWKITNLLQRCIYSFTIIMKYLHNVQQTSIK